MGSIKLSYDCLNLLLSTQNVNKLFIGVVCLNIAIPVMVFLLLVILLKISSESRYPIHLYRLFMIIILGITVGLYIFSFFIIKAFIRLLILTATALLIGSTLASAAEKYMEGFFI